MSKTDITVDSAALHENKHLKQESQLAELYR